MELESRQFGLKNEISSFNNGNIIELHEYPEFIFFCNCNIISADKSFCIGSFSEKLSKLMVEFNNVSKHKKERSNKIKLNIRDIVICKPILDTSLGIQPYRVIIWNPYHIVLDELIDKGCVY